MINLLKEHNKWNETLFLGIISIICFGLSILRWIFSGSMTFFNLNWNLFLASITWAISSTAIVFPKLQKNKLIISVLLLAWLLFFPNAPYIITNLLNLRLKLSMPVWFNLLLILSFAWTGLMFGFLSLMDIEKILVKSISRTWVSIISMGFLFLGSFGIYIGRYLRWNSWDIIRDPFGLFLDIGDNLLNKNEYPRALGMTIFLGIFLNLVYWSFRIIRQRD